jgi:hypothetical protein
MATAHGGPVAVDFVPTAVPIEDPALARLHAYWKAKRGTREFPARADIDPLDLGFILGWLILVDVSYDPLRFHLRLYGSHLVERMGMDLTGKDLTDHPCVEFRTQIAEQWREVIESRHPTHASVDGWVDERRVRYGSLRLPLSSDGRVIDKLLVAVLHLDVQMLAQMPAPAPEVPFAGLPIRDVTPRV